MKKINVFMFLTGLAGMVTMSIIAIVDSNAGDMISAVIVQLFFAALFVAGYISYGREKE